LVLNLLLLKNAEALGITQGLAVRIDMLAASLWWGLFSIITFTFIKKRGAVNQLSKGENIVKVGFREVIKTFRELIALRYTARFLLAYLFFNDGIQTVIGVSSVFIAQEIFVAKGLEVDRSMLLLLYLDAQIAGLIGALLFERIARFIGTKNTIIVTLVMWAG